VYELIASRAAIIPSGRAGQAAHGVCAGTIEAVISSHRAPALSGRWWTRVRLRDVRPGDPAATFEVRVLDTVCSPDPRRAGRLPERRGRMLLLKLIQSLIQTLHSEATRAGGGRPFVLGSILVSRRS